MLRQRSKFSFASAILLAVQLVVAPVPAAEIPHGVAASLQPFVDSHTLAGAVTLVASKDKILSLETTGYADIAARKPMRPDTLFWIASMSKAMTAAGLMVLVDEGKVNLDDPVEKYLPEFRGQMLGVPQEKGLVLLKKPKHPITVRNVLTHTSGLPFKTAIEEPTLDIYTLRERAVSYAMTPLLHEPDSKYLYSNAGINTAGAIIEVVSGLSFEEFMDKRLLKPLGMKDTTFWPNESQLKRLAKSYKANAAKTDLEETPVTQLKYPLNDHSRTPMPAGGYFSTAEDVAKFCQMLLNNGTLKGKRVLSEKAVRTMTTVQSGDAPNNGRPANYGFGLNVTVQSKNASDELSAGSYFHGGAYKTGMWVDPQRSLVLVLMVHHSTFAGTDGNKINPAFLKAALQNYSK